MRPNRLKPRKNSRNFCVFSAYSPVSLNLEAFSNDTRRFLSDCAQNKKKSSRFNANERIFCLSDKSQVFINRWSTQSANARQFGKGKVSALEGWIMAIERGGNIVLRRGLAPDLLPLCGGGAHSRAYPRANHRKFQFGENCAHLDKRLRHRVNFAVSAINRNGTDYNEAKPLFFYNIDDFTKLLRGARKPRNLQRQNCVARARSIQQQLKVLLYLRVAVFVFKDYFLRADRFQFANLTLNVLLVFVSGAARITVFHIDLL